ncbi:hypothetical protein, partial [Burkholderia cenocepacia]|uniref:hypothetical protein n=1 Tax=Burkholderia cenocepacia TaxID=95486 RepID=UPI001C8AE44D
ARRASPFRRLADARHSRPIKACVTQRAGAAHAQSTVTLCGFVDDCPRRPVPAAHDADEHACLSRDVFRERGRRMHDDGRR